MAKPSISWENFSKYLFANTNSFVWGDSDLSSLFRDDSSLGLIELKICEDRLNKLFDQITEVFENRPSADTPENIIYLMKLAQHFIMFEQSNGMEATIEHLNDSWAKASITESNKLSIQINSQLLRLLVMMNVVALDVINQINGGQKNEYNVNKINITNNAILYSFLSYIDPYDVVKGSNISISLNDDGFLNLVGLTNKTVNSTPYLMAFDHQLEFIFLHEFGHLFNGDLYTSESSSARELDADKFATKISRSIWNNCQSFHTSFCEFFQLYLFLLFDFYDFLNNAILNLSHLLMPESFREVISLPSYSDSHPHAKHRFLNVISSLEGISTTGRFFFSALEHVFENLKDRMILGEIDLTPLIQLARIKMQESIKNYTLIHTPEIDEEFIIIDRLDSFDHFFQAKNIIPPHIWLGSAEKSKLDGKEMLDKLLSRKKSTFSDEITSVFGPMDQMEIVNELQNGFKLNK